MTELQQNRYDQLMRRVGDLKGPGSKVNDALSELFPTIDVERVPPELLILGGTDACYAAVTITAAVAQFATSSIFNPVDSGKIITVTSFLAGTKINTDLFWGRRNTELSSGLGVQRFKDSRRPFTSLPSAAISILSAATSGDIDGRTIVEPDVSRYIQDIDSLAILSPGFGFQVAMASSNARLDVTWNWRERAAEPSELNL